MTRPASFAATLALLAALAPQPATPETAPETAHSETAFARAMQAARAGDTGTAAALFAPLARSGDAQAQFNLALLYYDGRGLPQNHAQALYWAWRARLSGIAQAHPLIALMADAATPDLRADIATRITADLTPRAQAGNGRAMLELSVVLTDLMPDPDLQAAYVWQALAAALETPNAAKARNATLARLPPEDRATAQTAALDHLRTLCTTGLNAPVCPALF